MNSASVEISSTKVAPLLVTTCRAVVTFRVTVEVTAEVGDRDDADCAAIVIAPVDGIKV